MNDYIDKLKTICQGWNGHLYIVTKPNFDKRFNSYEDNSPFSQAPFTKGHGVNWITKAVYATTDSVSVNGLIHEMGHVFAEAQTPDYADEWSWLGWEACLAKQIDCYTEWSDQNGAYGVHWCKKRDWRDLTTKQRLDLVENRIRAGIKAKIIDKQHRPLAIR